MYKLPYFTEDNNDAIIDFMMQNSFAIITAANDEFPVATSVPLDIKIDEGKIVLTGHIMKNTDHHKAFSKNNNVLVIFTGPHCYVSASWYTKQDVASTWNYISVHAKGKINFVDEKETREIVKAITNKYESNDSPAAFKNLPSEYVDRLVKAIIGFTIEVESFDNVFKLSQNHDMDTRQNIIRHLEKMNDDNAKTIATEMKKRIAASKKSL